MAESKKILEISFITDTETCMYQMGEIQGSFNDEELKKYIRSYGADELCKHMTFLQYQIMTTVREINREKNLLHELSTNKQK